MEEGGIPSSRAMAPSGSYVLIVVSHPLTEDHKEVILDRLNKGLLSWDVEATGCDLNGLESVCSNITSKQLRDSDVLIQHSTERLGVEVLVSPTVSTLKQCIKNLFSTSTGHKQLVHAGYSFAGSGAWILQNGAFSYDEFLDIFQHADVVRVQKDCHVNVHCAPIGQWTPQAFGKLCNVSLNPPSKVETIPGAHHMINCLRNVLSTQALEEIMEASPLVGNIRFNRPTLYMFPAGQGDCALFGINGFNMLVDGGFSRKPCSWEFIRHLDRLDAVLVTRLSENNLCGMSTLMKRKALNNTYPQIGYVFCNIADGKNREAPATDYDELVVSVAGEGHAFVQTLNDLKLKPHQCWRDSSIEPFVLYHKVGHGTLEMHVLSPPKDSKEMKDFLSEWSSYKETFSCVKSGLKSKNLETEIPLSHATSICAILVWRPADPKDTITRILFPGSAPQSKIFECLSKLKNLEILQHPTVTKASLSSKLVAKTKSSKLELKASIPNRKIISSPAHSVSSVASKNGDIGGLKKEVKKIAKKEIVNKEIKKDLKNITKEIKKESVMKDIKKDIKEAKESLLKKEVKEVKKVVKKEIKSMPEKKPETKSLPDKKSEVKVTSEKKSDVKALTKKSESTTAKTTETKKTTVIKKTTAKKETEVGKLGTSTKAVEKIDSKKISATKSTDLKSAKEVTNKKTVESKAISKTKPKASTASKTAMKTDKAKSIASSKPSSKITGAVAASSIVGAAVAVTAAAIELNEKKDIIEDIGPEIDIEKAAEIDIEKAAEIDIEKAAEIDIEKVAEEDIAKASAIDIEVEEADAKETKVAEDYDLQDEIVVSPLPREVLSPTPSESVSLTPSDTLSSAPLETVSPTPPLQNEPISIEEKEVNEIKSIDQDLMPDEKEMLTDDEDNKEAWKLGMNQDDAHDDVLEKGHVMTTSFMGEKDFGNIVEDSDSPAPVALANESANYYLETDNQLEIQEPIAVKNEAIFDEYSVHRFDGEIETSVDDPLAGATMEGSFCSGMMPTLNDQEEQFNEFNIQRPEVKEDYASEQQLNLDTNKDLKEFEDEDVDSDSVVRQGFAIREEHAAALHADNYEQLETLKSETTTEMFSGNSTGAEEIASEEINVMQEPVKTFSEYDHEGEEHVDIIQHNNEYLVTDEFQQESNVDDENDTQNQFDTEQFDSYNIKSNDQFTLETEKQADHNEAFEAQMTETEVPPSEDYESNACLNEMQTSMHQYNNELPSYDNERPEEIVRKESSVSITYNDNDEEPEDYGFNDRRKSGTESEDDVDLHRYLAKEPSAPIEPEKLSAYNSRNDSDDEDVVKSPTPHAIVDYEGQADELVGGTLRYDTNIKESDEDSAMFISKKNLDYDEKDRDSAEDDDEEMIRHPTPPGEKIKMMYSEEEMRDPIGPHFITTPHQSDITEQPLYEEPEDSDSERSQSPIVEQPVFGSVVQADFPELVTVSGGTTPSEPQSPKSGFELKKFNSDAALGVMEALSEHDCSESSTHSPLCHDESAAFDIPEKNMPEHHNELPVDQHSYESKSEAIAAGETCDDNVHCGEDVHIMDDIHRDEILAHPEEMNSKAFNIQQEETLDQQPNTKYNLESSYSADPYEQSRMKDTEIPDINVHDVSYLHQDNQHDIDFDQYNYQKSEFDHDINMRVDDKFDIHADNQDSRSDIHDSRSDIHEDVTAEIQDSKSDIHDSRSDIHEDVTSELHAEEEFDIHTEDRHDISGQVLDEHENIHVGSSEIHDMQGNKFSAEDFEQYNYQVPDPIPNQEIISSDLGDHDTDFNNVSQLDLESVRFHEHQVDIEQKTSSISFTSNENVQENIDKMYSEESKELFCSQSDMKGNNFEDVRSIDDKAYETELNSQFRQDEDVGYQTSTCLESSDSHITHVHEHLDDRFYQQEENFGCDKNPTNYELSNSPVSMGITSASNQFLNEEVIVGNEDLASETHLTEKNFSHSQSSAYEQFSKETIDTNLNSNELSIDAVSDLTGKLTEDSHLIETYSHSQYSTQNTTESVRTNGFGMDVPQSEHGDNLIHESFQLENSSSLINGKDQHWAESADYRQETFGLNSAYSENYTTNNLAKNEQDASYIINSRFHSDSPEDNVMRNDSSPDAPVDPAIKFAELKNTRAVDSRGYHNEDYTNNMNFPGSGVLPISPNNKMRNVNPENPYGESSEDEDSSSLPGTVSPYAYTNKAYTQEEEDVDGNHIYKESPTTEVITKLEFDGNNPQAVDTQRMTYSSGLSDTLNTADNTNYDFRLEDWGKPMGLPTPPETNQKTIVKKKSLGKPSLDNGKSPSAPSKMLTSSPVKKAKPKAAKESSGSFDPVYVDLAYVPHHGDPQYCDVEFFSKIRARYYVFSGINPSKEVLNALLEAKKSWNEDLEVTIIPTYETDTLGYWMAQNQDDLAQYSIEVAPSASRCTVNLQDHETSCAAYRLEF